MNFLGLLDLNPHNLLKKSKVVIKKLIIQKLKNSYLTEWKAELFNDTRNNSGKKNKLRTFRLFKSDFCMEPYLNILGFKERRVLTKFRIGSHNLEIELGRHKNIKSSDRLCKLCVDEVEDEIHFLLS